MIWNSRNDIKYINPTSPDPKQAYGQSLLDKWKPYQVWKIQARYGPTQDDIIHSSCTCPRRVIVFGTLWSNKTKSYTRSPSCKAMLVLWACHTMYKNGVHAIRCTQKRDRECTFKASKPWRSGGSGARQNKTGGKKPQTVCFLKTPTEVCWLNCLGLTAHPGQKIS